MNFTIEKDFQEHIVKDKELQKDICDLLNVDFARASFGREIEFVNRIVPDFTLFESGKIRAFIECKGGGDLV